jgi:sorbitol-specific phosphotransferase system component IIA
MPVACLVVAAPAASAVGSAAEAGAEVSFVVLVLSGNSQIHHPGVICVSSGPAL